STGHLQIGDIALYLGAVGQAQDRVMGLGNWSGHLSRLQLHLRSLFDFLDGARPAIALPSEGQGAPAPARFKEGVELRDRPLSLSGREPGWVGASRGQRVAPGGESDRTRWYQRGRKEHPGQT